jgi:hypothetical protein
VTPKDDCVELFIVCTGAFRSTCATPGRRASCSACRFVTVAAKPRTTRKRLVTAIAPTCDSSARTVAPRRSATITSTFAPDAFLASTDSRSSNSLSWSRSAWMAVARTSCAGEPENAGPAPVSSIAKSAATPPKTHRCT